VVQTASTADSYSYYQIGGGAGNTNSLGQFSPTDEGSVGTVLDVYKIVSGNATKNTAGTLVGAISIDSTGDVTFTAVPEPTTYAILGLGAGLLLMAARRRNALALGA
jgi:hypothetical protein